MTKDGKHVPLANDDEHFSSYWNPSHEFDSLAPHGIKLWSRVLRDVSGEPSSERFTLYGKISVTKKWGFGPSEIVAINRRVDERKRNRKDTHLYLYNTAGIDKHPHIPASLHVGLVDAVLSEAEVDPTDHHVPVEFYQHIKAKGLPVPFWFRLKDIRRIPIGEFENLEGHYRNKGGWLPFDKKDGLSPLLVRELDERAWFNPRNPEGRKGWYELDLVLAMSPEREQLEPGLFRSPGIIDLYARALRYAGSKFPALILGKEARGRPSSRNSLEKFTFESNSREKIGREDWPQFACGEFRVNPQLAQARRFGYKKGAFTGATESTKGC